MGLANLGILDAEYHQRLIQDIERISLDSRVPVRMITASATNYCSADQIDWLKNYKEKGSLCIVGETDTSPEMQLMAMAAVLIRNYVDGRVLTRHNLLEVGDIPDPTVMFIPNLFSATDGKVLTSWQVDTILDILFNRYTRDRITVVYVENMDALSKAYGKSFARHLTEAYTVLGN